MFTRRSFIMSSIGTGFTLAAPVLVKASSDIPKLEYGVASGSITHNSAALWTRADRPVKMHIDLDTDPSFKKPRKYLGMWGLPENDYNVKAHIQGLTPNTSWFYKVRCESLENTNTFSAPLTGQFKTAPVSAEQDIRFCWSGDTAGQGFGIDPNFGGMLTYKSMLAQEPDFLVHSGDQIYADGPLAETVNISDGRVWKNLITPGKSKVAETTQEFRENYYYNFLDKHVRTFHKNVPVFNQWDDHEVVNNWYPGEILKDDNRYAVKDVLLLAERSRRAMFDCTPIIGTAGGKQQIYRKQSYGPLLDLFFLDLRSFRGANSPNRQVQASPDTAFMGDIQLAWLKQALMTSEATWKIICSDMPLGLIVADGKSGNAENGANGDGPPLGREHEIASLLAHIAQEDVTNVHFITADVHYCASHFYDPSKAQFKNFTPFWEFVSGPLHAGTYGPNKLDNTFGPQVKFIGIPKDMQPGRSPADGFQFFGMIHIDAASRALTVSHHNRLGEQIWSMVLPYDA